MQIRNLNKHCPYETFGCSEKVALTSKYSILLLRGTNVKLIEKEFATSSIVAFIGDPEKIKNENN